MKIAIKTIQYIWKRFFYLFPFVFIPALLIALLPRTANNFIIFDYLKEDFIQSRTANFIDIYYGMTKNNKIETFYLFILMITIVPIFIATITGLIQRDMRIGDFSYSAAFNQLNRSLIQTFIFIFFLLLLVEIYLLFVSIFSFLLKLMFLNHPKKLIVLTTFIILILTMLTVTVAAIFCTVIPEMVYTGKGFFKSIVVVISKIKGFRLDITVCALIPTVLSYVVLYFTCYINNVYLRILISFFVIFLILIFVITMINVTFFEISGLERKDLKNKKINIKKI